MPDLVPGYRYETMSRAELSPYVQEHQMSVFAETGHLDSLYALSKTERTALDTLGERLADRYRLGYGIFQGDTFVG